MNYPMDSADFARAAALLASDAGFGLPQYAAMVTVWQTAAYRQAPTWHFSVQLTPLCGQQWAVEALEDESPAELLAEFGSALRSLRRARLREWRGYRRLNRMDARAAAGFYRAWTTRHRKTTLA